jgi:hypothetical protein
MSATLAWRDIGAQYFAHIYIFYLSTQFKRPLLTNSQASPALRQRFSTKQTSQVFIA